ncbi:hypothetical protein SAMN05444851_2650 [Aliiroseovarius sediminilitoris]|uniref:Uncharacterized protein n=1 Tax=Aliiroseovarius sediminilitoris TaxID=1173584 RepID=A0A1I0QKV7_9RHOB|nr:hypothetical protein SAMN05444851_2650 [Aliiroseovarius sediminilitoris]
MHVISPTVAHGQRPLRRIVNDQGNGIGDPAIRTNAGRVSNKTRWVSSGREREEYINACAPSARA